MKENRPLTSTIMNSRNYNNLNLQLNEYDYKIFSPQMNRSLTNFSLDSHTKSGHNHRMRLIKKKL